MLSRMDIETVETHLDAIEYAYDRAGMSCLREDREAWLKTAERERRALLKFLAECDKD